MRMLPWMLAALLVGGAGVSDTVAADAAAPAAAFQGKGKGEGKDGKGQAKGQKGNDKAQGQARGQNDKAKGQARGQSDKAKGQAKGQNGKAKGQLKKHGVSRAELRSNIDKLPANIRSLAADRRQSHRFVAGAAARSVLHGAAPGALLINMREDGIRVSNRDGRLLFDIDDDRARELGSWRLERMNDKQRGDGPAFCRSGEGHPVWGRNWCVEKGFGLGRQDGRDWSRTTDVGDIVFGRRDDRDRLDRGTLIDVVGDVVFNRLALHALSLGFTEPLTGTWIAEPSSPRILRIGSGNYAVAELVDIDRNDRVDVLLVAVPD